jgi:cell wall-associated NlpC family hydrolase
MQLGKPVLWGSKGPEIYDCSGLYTRGLYELTRGTELEDLLDWRATHNTDALFAGLDLVYGTPLPGDAVFYWPAKRRDDFDVEHVAVLAEGGLVITADGASSRIHTIEAAKEAHAIVRVRGDVNYRPRLAGYRRFPITEGPDGKPMLVCRP